ncbi:hypothetical protein B0H13DRAFT_2361109 [Mycena leptocephala]|nr:hypothetical protein B0H13DRAFT_2361109 [Mycena leptocephala]
MKSLKKPLPVWDKFAPVVAEELDEDETVRKRKRVRELNKATHCSLAQVQSTTSAQERHMDPRKDPFAILVSKLAGINSPPKARQAFQQYMHESYETEIAPTVKTRWSKRGRPGWSRVVATQKGPNAPFRAKVASVEVTRGSPAMLSEPHDADPAWNPGIHGTALCRALGGPIPKYGGELRRFRLRMDAAVTVTQRRSRSGNIFHTLLRCRMCRSRTARPKRSLGGAKYTFDDDVVLSEDESDSDDSGSDSDSDSDSAEESRNDWEEELTFDQRRQRNINQRREQLRVLDEAWYEKNPDLRPKAPAKRIPKAKAKTPRGAGEALSAAGSDVRQREIAATDLVLGGPTSSGDAAPASHLAVNTTSDSGAAPPSNPAPNGGAAAANLAPNGGAAAANPAPNGGAAAVNPATNSGVAPPPIAPLIWGENLPPSRCATAALSHPPIRLRTAAPRPPIPWRISNARGTLTRMTAQLPS